MQSVSALDIQVLMMLINDAQVLMVGRVMGSKAVDCSHRNVRVEIMRVMETDLPIRSLDH
jgi:hypothetical protein